ncbi:MAG TPA: hypothetical protein VKM37_00205 [Balneolaceae bacterium]|nr:hypothetical protein [Balneolaceae bacterium]
MIVGVLIFTPLLLHAQNPDDLLFDPEKDPFGVKPGEIHTVLGDDELDISRAGAWDYWDINSCVATAGNFFDKRKDTVIQAALVEETTELQLYVGGTIRPVDVIRFTTRKTTRIGGFMMKDIHAGLYLSIISILISNIDGFVKSPISVLRCIPRNLRALILNFFLCHLKIDFQGTRQYLILS